MRITTKFDFKDKVFSILKKQKSEWVKCGFCGGEGKVIGMDKKDRICPYCYGERGHSIHIGVGWEINETLTIGEIRVEHRCSNISYDGTIFDNYGSQDEKYTEAYMCYETGIGSGTLHDVDNIFSTEKKALEECQYRNKKEGLS